MGGEDGEKPGSANSERERRILEAAGRLITHYGYDKTTVADIAQEAGISKGAIYLHFESKENLFSALILYESHRVLTDTLQRIEADSEGGTFVSLYRHSLAALAANPLMRALTTRNKRILGESLRKLSESGRFDGQQEAAKAFVIAFQEAGLLRTDLTSREIFYFLSIVRYGLLLADDFLPPEDVLSLDVFGEKLTNILERGLVPPEGGDREAGKRIIAHWIKMAQEVLDTMRRKV
jgi:AcrR family transcriptional regulator